MENWYDAVIKKKPDKEPQRRPVKELSHSSKAVDIIKRFEGFRRKAYLDSVGVPTIGYGFTKDVSLGQTITKEDAVERLEDEIVHHTQDIKQHVKVPLHQYEYDALASFIFNVGKGAFNRSTLLKKLNVEDYKGAADEILRWDKAGGKSLKGLTRRRKEEREMFLGG